MARYHWFTLDISKAALTLIRAQVWVTHASLTTRVKHSCSLV